MTVLRSFRAFLVIILVLSQLQQVSSQAVTLYYHQWCKLSASSIQIFKKLKQDPHFHSIDINTVKLVGEDGRLDNQNNAERYQRHKQLINGFPTIILENCGGHNVSETYQNSLSVVELSYWIQVQCLQKIPLCTNKLKEDLPIQEVLSNISNQLQVKVLAWIIKHPGIRVCANQTLNNQGLILQRLSNMQRQTYIYQKLTHNIRNYLIKTQKTAIISFATSQGSLSARVFRQCYERITNFKNKSLQASSYQIPRTDLSHLVFISTDIDKKMSRRLLDFLDISYISQNRQQQIVAIRFKDYNLYKEIYTSSPSGQVLGSRFIYWLHQMVNLGDKSSQSISKEAKCLSDYIVHRYSHYDLEAIRRNVELKRRIRQEGLQIGVKEIRRRWWSQQSRGINLCIKGKVPRINMSLQSVLKTTQEQLKDRVSNQLQHINSEQL